MIVKRATPADILSVERLWQTVFGDEIAEIRSFLSNFPVEKHAFVIRQGNVVVSMLFLIEAALVCGDRTEPIGYIYAGATHPSARGKGLYRQLLQAVETYAAEAGMKAVFLQPADAVLAKTYERMGFTVPMVADRLRGSCVPQPLTSVTAQEYCAFRYACLEKQDRPFVEWPMPVYRHAGLWASFYKTESGDGFMVSSEGVVLERFSPSGSQETCVGLLKWLDHSSMIDFTNAVYFGYGMD